jgi:hypothetical protein
VLTRGPFAEPVQANLVIARDTMQVAWLVSCYVARIADFTIVIAASGDDPATVLYCAAEAASAVCSAHVYLFNPGEGPLISMVFPRPVADYPAGIRPASAFHDRVDAAGGPVGNQFVTAVGSDDEQV